MPTPGRWHLSLVQPGSFADASGERDVGTAHPAAISASVCWGFLVGSLHGEAEDGLGHGACQTSFLRRAGGLAEEGWQGWDACTMSVSDPQQPPNWSSPMGVRGKHFCAPPWSFSLTTGLQHCMGQRGFSGPWARTERPAEEVGVCGQ